MERTIWIVRQIILSIRYSRLFWVYRKKAWNIYWLSSNKNINKIENRTTSKITTAYYLQLLTPETIKLLGSTKSKKTKDQNGENVPHLEITVVEVVVAHCNIANNEYQQDSRALYICSKLIIWSIIRYFT